MSMTRALILRGPAAILWKSQTFYTLDDIKVVIALETRDLTASAFGKVDEVVLNRKIEVTATPIGLWAGGSTDFANRCIALFTWINALPGTAIFPATQAAETPLVIWTTDGTKYTFPSAAITKMPSINLSTEKVICGPVTWTCLEALAASTNIIQAWSVASMMEATTSVAFTDATFSTSDILEDSYTAVWGSIAGFTGVETKNGFTIEPSMTIQPVTTDTYGIIDYTLGSVSVTCKFQPVGSVTPDNMIAAMKIQGTGSARGMSLASIQSSTDLVISGSTTGRLKVTLKGAQLKSGGMAFGLVTERVGELEFITTRNWTNNVTGDLILFSAVGA